MYTVKEMLRQSHKVAEFLTDESPVRPPRSRTRMRKSASVVSNRTSISNPLPHDGAPVLTVGDDCAINELLEGRMELDVILPDENKVRMTVERKMPMMDLLVQVTTANKISPGGHVIQVLTERGKEIQYKPNTPIGSLDTNIIYIVSKSSVMESTAKKLPKIPNKPFEQTFRLQVKLPRNQLTVLRVSPKMTLAEVKRIVCSDKNLDINNYHLVRSNQPNNILDLNITLASYGSTEISLLSNKSITANIYSSATDLIAYSTREDEKTTKRGILGMLTRKKSKGSLASSSSDGANSQGDSPNSSNDQTDQVKKTVTVKPSIKKRPAPPPPSQKTNSGIEISDQLGLASQLRDDNGCLLASHSRQSSDSSGYHEASVFSELPENTSPETSSGSGSSGLEHSDTLVHSAPYPPLRKILASNKDAKSHRTVKSNLIYVPSASSISVVSAVGKKRKAPPPPKRDISKPELDPVREMSAAGENGDIQSEVNQERLEHEFGEGIDVIENTRSTDHEDAVTFQAISEPSSKFAVVPSPPSDDVVIHSLQPNPPPEFADNSDESAIENLEKKSQLGEMNFSSDSAFMSEDGCSISDCSTVFDLVQPPEAFTNFHLCHSTNHDCGDYDATAWSSSFVNIPPFDPSPGKPTPLPISKPQEEIETTNEILSYSEEQTVKDVQQHQRQNSLSSIDTIDDIENTFRQTIAEGERALERDQEKEIDRTSDMTKGSACFNQNITQHQLLSHIEATFSAVEQQAEDVLLYEPSSEYNTLPGPPHSFRDNEKNHLQQDEDEKLSSTEFCAVPSTLSLELHDAEYHEKSKVNIQEQAVSVKQTHKVPLTNFVISSYKKERENIYGSNPRVNTELFQQSVCASHFRDETVNDVQKHPDNIGKENKVGIQDETAKPRCKKESIRKDPNLNVQQQKNQEFLTPRSQSAVHLEDGSVQGFRRQIKLRCTQLTDLESSPLTGRSTSMLNLVPLPAVHIREHRNTHPGISETLRRVQSEHNVNNTSCNSEFSDENKELQAKYEQLKEQLLGWQQKIVQNQKLLQNGETSSKVIAKSLEQNPFWINDTRSYVKDSAEVKLQKLSKEKLVHQDVGLIKKRQVLAKSQKRPKSQMLTNVTIGSWQQRNHQEDPGRSKCHSVENLTGPPSELQMSTMNGKCIDSCFTNTLNVPKSSFEPKEEPKLDIQMTSQGEKPLSSSLKSVDMSGKHKQTEPESHCSNRLSLREPKVIKVSNNNYKTGAIQTYFGAPVVKGFSNEVIQNLLKEAPPQKSVIQTNESGNFSLGLKSNKNGTTISRTDLNMQKMNLPAKSNNQQLGSTNCHQNIPPPSSNVITTVPAHTLSSKCKPKEKKKTSDFSDIDPRDKLMIDIRNFRGRSALRKVTVAETNWQLKAS
ncbi:uncharacterized protein LOC106461033 isoform X2 [Limulus polyphemus]|uniref:Uncharacterized protein LOC106461033 isoform X2 n=1 Tax=Limulus polyphemus TaxID=6850 RepID=A0ABM1B7B4_LIMPO|nr:uncharacterized protein LOC106461033 isoform X2 [Limulus polyphemus]